MSKTTITAKMTRDGTLTVTDRDGRKKVVTPAKSKRMNEAEVEAAAISDPDNPPLTAATLAKLTPVPRIKTLRRALALTQEEFAARYQIPLGTLRDWEQGRSQPDQPTRAYLTVIARDPEGVRTALRRKRG
jgi:putative transcriptional regulator